MDLYQSRVFIFYPLLEPMISPLDVLGPGVVGRILRKMDGTFGIAIEPEFLMLDP